MPKKRRKQRVERRTLADGTVTEYRYGPRSARASTKTVALILGQWELSQEFLALGPNTAKAYIRYATPLYDALKSAEISKVKRRHLLTIRDHIAATRGQGAALQFCKIMAVFFAWAADRDLVSSSPAFDLKGPLRRGEWTAWTLDQALKAEAALPRHYARAVFLARWTAQRRGDLCRMAWADYRDGEIHVIQEKTGAELFIPVAPPLAEALAVWRQDSQGPTILQQPNGKPLSPASLSVRLPKELQRIGLPSGLGIHGLRKLAAACLADAGCSTHEIAAITGHETLGMVAHYTRSADQRILGQKAMERLVKTQIVPKCEKM